MKNVVEVIKKVHTDLLNTAPFTMNVNETEQKIVLGHFRENPRTGDLDLIEGITVRPMYDGAGNFTDVRCDGYNQTRSMPLENVVAFISDWSRDWYN